MIWQEIPNKFVHVFLDEFIIMPDHRWKFIKNIPVKIFHGSPGFMIVLYLMYLL
jgi:hypothetical protein